MTDNKDFQGRINQLIELYEYRRNTLDHMVCNKYMFKGTFDQKERQRNFKEVDQVLMWVKRKEKPIMHKNFDSLWTGPY
jgi:hypothetical protein